MILAGGLRLLRTLQTGPKPGGDVGEARSCSGAEADIAGATDSTYTLTDDDQGKPIKVKVTFSDDKGNSETRTSPVTANVRTADADESEPRAPFLVSNLEVGVAGAGGIQRTLGAARSGFAQAFTTGTKTGGYALEMRMKSLG